MIHFIRLRPRLTKLTFPFIWLALIAGALSFFNSYKLETWQLYSLQGAALVLAIFLWLIPSISYSAKYVDVTSQGILISAGIGKKTELAWSQISSIRNAGLKGISIITLEENEHILRGYSNQREIAAQMQLLHRGK